MNGFWMHNEIINKLCHSFPCSLLCNVVVWMPWNLKLTMLILNIAIKLIVVKFPYIYAIIVFLFLKIYLINLFFPIRQTFEKDNEFNLT